MTEQDKQALIKHFCSRDCGEAAEGCTIMPCHEIELIQEFQTTEADSDTISRSKAIEALKQQAETMNEWSNRYAEQRKGILTAVNIVEDLPPAQLGTNLADVGTDAISRQSAIEVIERARAHIGHNMERAVGRVFSEMLDDVGLSISKLPPIQPKKGRWIRTGSGSLYDHYECSECGKTPRWECMGDNRWKIAFTDFCPNCGADMREKGENSESN